ncbi:predicted protein [Phaeodactylum tricornutum CCAP 1055/1]|jgi:hypothetical protein|uniref:Uncharacterized protein n=2 Tax=Phaeodactylum tricornutum TaxID=2850 RepID=B7G1K7_PHATC|nr:predicted protein [Phaeodactylum tricornutum CCAP 1055/1]EEC47697.1 predicted protein [Phaeodactylum tricornutum CCAP 1055/1]|eukprot:XP_002181045.1 predicted protein [Phaeodactylum tricornutum CCAP 1055/1]
MSSPIPKNDDCLNPCENLRSGISPIATTNCENAITSNAADQFSTASTSTHQLTVPTRGGDNDETSSYDCTDPYRKVLALASRWTAELESVRSDLYMLQIQNAIALDTLTMAGAATEF